ncbi:polyprenyl synthetase family protein [Streptomyces sp. NBC_00271]|uniref:polyprenyl synthetase family protein n=1 Tax=Streptomyces sp. NBC_00271 TaxID=2975697 RepID=UPI002E29C5B5|nr:polyprenyl synthetase family protein [Streptomyces sp. NBC_00271]
MTVVDITPAYSSLLVWEDEIAAAVRSFISRLGDSCPSVADVVVRLIDTDFTKASVFRLLPFPVLSGLGGDTIRALPVAVASRIWWTGAEVFDDLADGQYDDAATGVSAAQAAVGSAACVGVIPLAVLDHWELSPSLRTHWSRELVKSSLHAAEGQLSDVSSASAALSWATVMRGYAGKCGAPYARDAAMAAHLAGASDEMVRGWRAFGQLFGVMRQLANDRGADSAEVDEDLVNGTQTLLLAHAFETAGGATELEELTSLRVAAQSDVTARVAFGERLSAPGIATTYNRRIDRIHRHLCALLEALAPASGDRALLRWMLNTSVEAAHLHGVEGAA